MKRVAAWQLLVPKYFKSKKDALGFVLAGKVYTADFRIEKIGQLIPTDSIIIIKDINKKYVSRGGYKLEGALKDFNISDIKLIDLDPKPDLIVADLSYLSLIKAIPILARMLKHDGRLLCLIKPFFEVKDVSTLKSVMTDDSVYDNITDRISEYIQNMGFHVIGIKESRIKGCKGTREFFIYFTNKWRNSIDFH